MLIARYGKMEGSGEHQGRYTSARLAATLTALRVAPWESAPPGPMSLLLDSLIVLDVWRFAGALTKALSRDGDAALRRGRRLYGLERLTFEQARSGPARRPQEWVGEDPSDRQQALAGLEKICSGC